MPLTEFLTYRLLTTVHAANRASARWHQANTHLLLAEWRIVAMLGYFGPSTGRRLSERLGMDKAVVSRVKSNLVERGLVGERALPADSRKRLLALTRRGRALYRKYMPLVQARQRELMALLSAEELAAFDSALAKLERHFHAAASGGSESNGNRVSRRVRSEVHPKRPASREHS